MRDYYLGSLVTYYNLHVKSIKKESFGMRSGVRQKNCQRKSRAFLSQKAPSKNIRYLLMPIRRKMFNLMNLTMPEKVKGGPFKFFKHPICCKISKRWRHSFFFKKCHTAGKKQKGGPLVSSGFVCYVKKRENDRRILCTFS